MAVPIRPVLSGLCPRLVSSAGGQGEDCPFVTVGGHTGLRLPLPALSLLGGSLTHTCPSGKGVQAELPSRPQCTNRAGLRQCKFEEAVGVFGLGSHRLFWPGRGRPPQQRVETVCCRLTAFSLQYQQAVLGFSCTGRGCSAEGGAVAAAFTDGH